MFSHCGVWVTIYFGGLVIINISNSTAPAYSEKLDIARESWDVKVSDWKSPVNSPYEAMGKVLANHETEQN